MQNKKILHLYKSFLKKYPARGFWDKWCKRKKTKRDREEIAFGAILTQRTNWRNVERALKNLKEAGALSVSEVRRLGKRNRRRLETLLRPSGFYRQKSERLFRLCDFIVKEHGTFEKFFQQELAACREQLLKLPGVGPETADSILLYAGGKPIFVIDEYTRRLAQKRRLAKNLSYKHLQELFQNSVPKDAALYQDFHALIVLDGKK